MSKRTATWLAWSMCALSLVLTALSILLLALNLSHPNAHVFDYWGEFTVVAIAGATVGAVIASRRPENPIGWIFCTGGGLAGSVQHFGAQYATYTLLAQPGWLPGGEALAWLSSWIWTLSVGLFVFLCLLFPNGRLPSSRWRWVAWFSTTVVLAGAVGVAFQPGPIDGLGSIRNPLGHEGFVLFNRVSNYFLVQALLGAAGLVSAASLFVRLHRSEGEERQQLKWFVYAATFLASGVVLAYTISRIVDIPWLQWLGVMLVIVGATGIPIAVGIGILKHRLFEIDLIINRTLVYGSLTGLLALLYFGSVTALQYLFSLLTGQGDTLAIVASTLAIAALFSPLRRLIQSFIERRFYRRKYDVTKTLEAFGSKLRDETDLEKLCEDLAEVVDETMQPSHISLWLRFPSSPPPNSSESSSEVRSSMQSEPPPQ
jgi:hypothetical protein